MTGIPGGDVSRETLDRLSHYADLLIKWNTRINLVSTESLKDLWVRHMADSMQLHGLAPHPVDHWVDLGSGGGFPGLVIALMAMEARSPNRVTLVESDARKSAFLRTVIRETGAPGRVVTGRIEDIEPLGGDVVSARALKDLRTLLGYGSRHAGPDGTLLFPKGESWRAELADAQSMWRFAYRIDKSKTESGSVIMSITGVARV